jgi:hypothetical protein
MKKKKKKKTHGIYCFFFRIFGESIKENRFFETLLTMIDLPFFFYFIF